MKKTINNYPLLIIIGLFIVAILGITFGSFFDYNISRNIVNTSSPFGAFVESYGLSFGFIIIDIAGVLLFKGFIKNEKLPLKILGLSVSAICLFASVFFFGKFLMKAQYGITYDTWLAYLIAVIVVLASTLFFLYFIKSDDTKGLITTGFLIVSFMIVQYGLIELFKNMNSRPRYRYLSDSSLNIANDVFSPWWNFNPFSAKSDYFKSWPSGHTGTAAVTLTLPLVAPFFRKQFKFLKITLIVVSILYLLSIAFFRIYYGAHFLSDVSFAILFTTIIFTSILLINEKIINKQKC